MISENWDPPSFAMSFRNPALRKDWATRVAAWEAANPELSVWMDEAQEIDRERRRIVAEAENARFRLESTGTPERCVLTILGGLKPTTASEAVSTFMASDKTFLLLSGAPGCGKTVAACSALRKGGLFHRAVEISRLSAFDSEDRRVFDRAKKESVLVLDDLGAEMLHDGWRPALDELLDTRYGSMLKTILTTNLAPTAPDGQPSFRTRYGERIADRIRHDGFIESCGSTSMRRKP